MFLFLFFPGVCACREKLNLVSVLRRNFAISFISYLHIRVLDISKSLESFVEDKGYREEFQIWVVCEDTVTY